MKTASIAVSALASLPGALAWGALGHETVGYIASSFVTASTKKFAQDLLNDTSVDYLAAVATWADSYRYTSAGSFSAPYHYIDANDQPPHSCGVDFDRDCGAEGCVVAAIANYTSRIQDDRLSAAHQAEALKFIVHFVGDIHQPLHDENLAVGGNDINVTFTLNSDPQWNLHAVWDTAMLTKAAGTATLPHAKTLAANLTAAIKSGAYKNETAGWLSDIELDDAKGTSLGWAQYANQYVCTAVIPDGVAAVEDVDLSGEYYAENIKVVEKLLAAAGYRLAAWLNLIATGSTGFEEKYPMAPPRI